MSADGQGDKTGQGGVPATDVAGKPISKDEVSGLHEIQALAAGTIARRSKEMRAPSEPGLDSGIRPASGTGPLPVMTAQVVLPQAGKEVAPPVVQAVAAETTGPTQVVRTSKAGLFVGAAGVLIAAGAIAFVSLQQKPAPAPATAAAAAPTAVQPEQPAAAAKADEAVAAIAPAATDKAEPTVTPVEQAATAEAAVARDDEAKVAEKAAKDDGKARDDKNAGKAEKAEAKKADAVKAVAKDEKKADAKEAARPDPNAPPSGQPSSEIDAIFGDNKPAAAKVDTGPALPEKLSQNDVKNGMSTVKARVQACYDEYKVPGAIKLKVKINASGEVASADVVDDKFKGTPTGACVSSAVMTAKFPKVSGSPLTVTYPFLLQ